MANETELAAAKAVYADLCNMLDERGWHYQKHDEDLVITYGVRGDDIPMDFVFMVDAGRKLLSVLSKLPFTVPEDKRMDFAIATCYATNRLADGSFDFNIAKGDVVFRMTASFRESKIGSRLFAYMIDCASNTVDRYNDKFLLLCKGLISIDKFIGLE